jgi:hypothetical protein
MVPGAEPSYYRYETPTQSVATAFKQRSSGEIWGRIPWAGCGPVVEAYIGALPAGRDGIEFTVALAPEQGTPPGHAHWRPPRIPTRMDQGTLYAVLAGVTITKIVHNGRLV